MKNLRWYMAGLLMLATTICYLDRQALTIASVVIKDLYHLTPKDYANIVMAYTLAYGFMQPFAGRLIDWMSTRRGLATSVFTWSIAEHGPCTRAWCSVVFDSKSRSWHHGSRQLPRSGQGCIGMVPPKERATATGIYNCGAGLGAIIAPLLMGVWLIPHYGWQMAFLVTSSLGLLWVWAWLRLYSSARAAPFDHSERAGLYRGRAGERIGRGRDIFGPQRVAGSAVATRVLGAGNRTCAL